jgi:transposase
MAQIITGVAGLDIGKGWIDAAIHQADDKLRILNEPGGYAELICWLEHNCIGRVGMEATGGYERGVSRALREAGFEVVLLQPAQVRAYAGFKLRRAKNDRLDAELIAACAAAVEARQAPDLRLEAFAEHLTFLEQIEEDLRRAKTRLEGFRLTAQRDRLQAEIKRLKRLRDAELGALVTALGAEPDLADRLALAQSVPGVGQRTAVTLIVLMPELGRLTREQAASLAGLAPFDDDSGKRSGARHIKGGRERVRTSLYAAALPAAFQWNPALVALYRRLKAKGKQHKLILTACARKLLVYVNTVLQRQTPWVDNAPC